jgi:hypothetical protein
MAAPKSTFDRHSGILSHYGAVSTLSGGRVVLMPVACVSDRDGTRNPSPQFRMNKMDRHAWGQKPSMKTCTMKSYVTLSMLASSVLLLNPGKSNGQAISTLHPEKVVGSERCEECHSEEIRAWKNSTHAKSDQVHRDEKTKERAQEIAARMGIKNVNEISTHPLCTECHFTRQKNRAGLKVIGGVSCESCHGGGKDYRDVHGNKDEIPSREERQKQSKAMGMLYPDEIYKVAENCYSCHVIRDEKLVNVGGHRARSEGFNLVEWNAGEVRHNFYDADYTRNEKINLETRIERKRMFYVVGMLLDLEHSLRGLAASSGDADPKARNYRYVMGSTAVRLRDDTLKGLPRLIGALGGEAGAPKELLAIKKIVDVVSFRSQPDLLQAADAIKAQIEVFGRTQDGTDLGALDALLPVNRKGRPYLSSSSPTHSCFP